MKILEFARSALFCTADFLKGGSIKGHINDIAFIQDNYPKKGVVERHNTYLKNVLEHAAKTVPYYKNLEREGIILKLLEAIAIGTKNSTKYLPVGLRVILLTFFTIKIKGRAIQLIPFILQRKPVLM